MSKVELCRHASLMQDTCRICAEEEITRLQAELRDTAERCDCGHHKEELAEARANAERFRNSMYVLLEHILADVKTKEAR